MELKLHEVIFMSYKVVAGTQTQGARFAAITRDKHISLIKESAKDALMKISSFKDGESLNYMRLMRPDGSSEDLRVVFKNGKLDLEVIEYDTDAGVPTEMLSEGETVKPLETRSCNVSRSECCGDPDFCFHSVEKN